jgi:hypothetical protein
MISKEQLDAWEKLAGQPISGPWVVSATQVYSIDNFLIATPVDNVLWANGVVEANAAFIAASRTAVPALIAEVKSLQEVVAWLQLQVVNRTRDRNAGSSQREGRNSPTPTNAKVTKDD